MRMNSGEMRGHWKSDKRVQDMEKINANEIYSMAMDYISAWYMGLSITLLSLQPLMWYSGCEMPADSRPGAGKIKNMLQSFKTKVQRKDRKLQHYKFIKSKLYEIIRDSDSLIILYQDSNLKRKEGTPNRAYLSYPIDGIAWELSRPSRLAQVTRVDAFPLDILIRECGTPRLPQHMSVVRPLYSSLGFLEMKVTLVSFINLVLLCWKGLRISD